MNEPVSIYKVELLVLGLNYDPGEEEIKILLEDHVNGLEFVSVMDIQKKEITDWDDDHPLNVEGTMKAEYDRLFSEDGQDRNS